jgi:hypothetical protein
MATTVADYAEDADLLAYVPATSTISSTLRGYALADAAAMIDSRWFGNKTRRAHIMLATHYLALTTDTAALGTGESGIVQSQSAGDISVTYATTSTTLTDPGLASTKWGRLFLEIQRTVPHSGASA